MDIFGNYISKCNRLSKNIRHIKALYQRRTKQKHYLISSKTPCIRDTKYIMDIKAIRDTKNIRDTKDIEYNNNISNTKAIKNTQDIKETYNKRKTKKLMNDYDIRESKNIRDIKDKIIIWNYKGLRDFRKFVGISIFKIF